MSEEKFHMLKYSHEEIQYLLELIDKHKNGLLTMDQYNQLIYDIGLDNISTFDGNYYSLEMRPIIPTRTSQLYNNTTYQTEKDIIEYDSQKIQPIRDDIELLQLFVDDLSQLDLENMLQRMQEAKKQLIELEESLYVSNKTVEDIRLYVSNHEDSIKYINEKIEARRAAKLAKNYAEADAIRVELLSRGITLIDTREGTKFTIS
jgi:cysteinyl-tRNA synthetase